MQANRVVEVSHTQPRDGFERAFGHGDAWLSAVVRSGCAVRVARPTGGPGVAP